MSERPAFTTGHADTDAALNAFIDLLPAGTREAMDAIEDAMIALETATDKKAANHHLSLALKRLQDVMYAAKHAQEVDHD